MLRTLDIPCAGCSSVIPYKTVANGGFPAVIIGLRLPKLRSHAKIGKCLRDFCFCLTFVPIKVFIVIPILATMVSKP
jgi:hypothetical protein